MTTPPMTLAALTTEMQELREIFTSFRRLLTEGHLVDMTGMDDRIREFCTHVEQADPVERKTLLPEFTILLDMLESLETELRTARDRVKQ